nr:ATP-binding protein [Roseomonas sp. GC11]
MHHRMGLGQERRLDIHIALQEALTNALLHGNLGLGSELRGSFAGLGLLQEKIETGLSDPLRANRPVVVVARPAPPAHLWLEVRDYGQGFFPSGALPEGPAAPHAPRPGTPLGTPPPPHGRGLGLIRCLTESCEWRQESRTLAMLFPLAEAGGA